ncbi:DDE-type integrase/transposase/recombinase [Paraburkholderia phymatum]|uniref:DDE-type integrase/transposase/recombinase n=1 Tax=Paraburkholderia phymatum TaxID=148447 RepID=UPI00317E6F75
MATGAQLCAIFLAIRGRDWSADRARGRYSRLLRHIFASWLVLPFAALCGAAVASSFVCYARHATDGETVTLDSLTLVVVERETPIRIRQVKYLNNIVEQDHRAIKRIIKPMMGFKDFRCARIILSGIEVMHMIRKGQMKVGATHRTVAEQFYLLAT